MEKPAKQKDLGNIADLPFIKTIACMVVMCVLFWGGYFELSRHAAVFPIGMMNLLDFYGAVLYFMTALVAVALAGAVLYKGITSHEWDQHESNLFFGTLIVSAVFLITGIQFLYPETLAYDYPYAFLMGKLFLVALLIRYLIRILFGNTGIRE